MKLLCQGAVKQIRRVLPKGEFSRNVTILAASSAFAQGISIVAVPVLTRLYTPADYGIVALFNSVMALLMVVATLRYEWAIPNPATDEEAINIFFVCFLAMFAFAMLTVFAIILLFGTLDNFGNVSVLKPYLWLIPLYILGGASYQTLNAWAIRKKSFKPIAKTRISQSVSSSITTIGLGFLKGGPLGLLLGGLVGQTAGIGTLSALLWNEDREILKGIRKKKILAAFKRYFNFAALSTGTCVVNTASLQMTTILLSVYFEAGIVGWYYLAQRVIGIPTGLVGQATGQAFWAEAARLIRSDPRELRRIFHKFSKKLAMLSLLIAAVGIVSPFVFGFVFGSENWSMAGKYALYLTPMIMAQFIVGTLSHLVVHELQHWQLIWDICRLILTVFCFWATHRLGWTGGAFIMVYSLMMSGMYLILYMMNIKALQIKIKEAP